MKKISLDELTQPANTGDFRAQLVLGWQLLTSRSSPATQHHGLSLIKSAADAESLERYLRLAYWKETTGDVECMKMFKGTALRSYSPAMYELGNMHWAGCLLKKDRRRAGVYWRMAVNHGHSLARLRMRALPLHKPFSARISKP